VETEVIQGDTPGVIVQPRQVREQLFRIYSVVSDSEGRYVEARARHISYDLGAAVVNGKLSAESMDARELCARMAEMADHETGVNIICGVSGAVTGEFGGKNLLECLLDPQEGIAAQVKAKVVRDNFDIFLLPDEERDRGVEIRYGKNLLAAQLEQDCSDVVTRIIPVGKDEEGEDLFGEAVDSARIDEYPQVRTAVIEYDVKAGKELSREGALAMLREKAQADMDAGCDLPTARLNAEFVRLELAEEYAALANAYALHLYDSVPVRDWDAGIDVKVRMVGYVYDAILRRYVQTELGDISEISTLVYGYELADGTIGGSKIANGTITGGKLRNLSVGYAKISAAAIEQLSADAIAAVRAHIQELVAGEITTDELYADLAVIAAAQITQANIERAQIDWAQIEKLSAEVADIANAQIGAADIDYAKIKDMVAGSAIITEGVGGKLYISRLAVTEANMVSLTTGELILKNEDGDFVRLSVDGDGNVTGTVVQVEGGNIAEGTVTGSNLIENAITARELNVESIFADRALIRAIKAANIDVADLFAADAVINELDNYLMRTQTIEGLKGKLDLWAEEKISLAVGGDGRNLLRGTRYWDGEWWIGAENGQKEGEILRLAGVNGVVSAAQDVALEAGEKYVLSLELAEDFAGGGSMLAYAYDADNAQAHYVLDTSAAKAAGLYSAEFTAGGENYRVIIAAGTGAQFAVRHMQLEKGARATDWTPSALDNAGGVDTGSGAGVRVRITSSDIEFDVPGESGDSKWDSSGFHAPKVSSPSVRPRYDGPVQISVGAGTADGVQTFASLTDALYRLTGKYIPQQVTVTVAQGEYVEAAIGLHLTDGAPVVIDAAGAKINGRLVMSGTRNRVIVNGLEIGFAGGDNAVYLSDCYCVVMNGCAMTTDRTLNGWSNALYADRSNVELHACGLYGGYAGVFIEGNAKGLVDGCTGSGNEYGLFVRNNAAVGAKTSVPQGAAANVYCEADSEVRGTTVSSGGNAPDAPETMQTAELTAVETRTVYGSARHSGGSWYNASAKQLAQGAAAGAIFHGCMWFNLSAIAGKQIGAAKLKLYRLGGVGAGMDSNACIATMRNSAPGGSLQPMNAYGLIGAVDQEEEMEVTIPAAAVQELANGTAAGLYVYSSDGSYWGDRNYSRNYMQFAGVGTNKAPVLTVTFA